MADLPIPGASNQYSTPEVRRSLLERDYDRLDKLEEESVKLNEKKEAWSVVRERFSTLNDTAVSITRFDSPLKQMFGNSTNPLIITAQAQPSAEEAEYEVLVEQKAGVDRFASTMLPSGYKPPSGEYIFSVGEKEIKFNFNGGNLSDWIKTLNRRGTNFIKAETFKSGAKQENLIITSLKEGDKNSILFKGMAEEMALDLGMLSEAKVYYQANLSEVANSQSSSYNKLSFSSLEGEDNEGLIIQPSSEASFTLPLDFEVTDKSLIKVSIAVRSSSDYDQETNSIRSPLESVTYGNITIENEFSELIFDKTQNLGANAKKIQAISAYGDGQTNSLEPILDLPDIREMVIPLGKLLETQEINITNTTKDKLFIITSFEVLDPRNRDGYLPLNALSYAQDAIIELDGIEVTRPTNKITDLIPKVAFDIHEASEDYVKITIEPDVESIKNSVLDFIISYNILLAYASVMTSYDSNSGNPNFKSPIIEEFWSNEEEKKQIYQMLGIFKNDSMLSTIKNSLQVIVSSAYDTDDERYRLLSQIGIAPRGNSNSNSKIPYLTLDDAKFENSLKENISAVQQLFAQDTTGDSISNEGLAPRITSFAKPYIQFNGLLDTKIEQTNSEIKRKDKEVENYRDKLEDKDAKLQRDLRKLEGTLQQTEAQRRSINQYLNPPSNDRNN